MYCMFAQTYIYLHQLITTKDMKSIEILTNSKSNNKPYFLFETIEEFIQERDRMESNWNDSMRLKMNDLSRLFYSKFKVLLSSI